MKRLIVAGSRDLICRLHCITVANAEGARGLDASEALREARVQGMREALAAMRTILKEDVWGTPYIDLDDAEEALDAAIEAVRKGGGDDIRRDR